MAVKSIEVDIDDWGIHHTCGGTNLQATLSQGNLECRTSDSGPFSGGETVQIYGGECMYTEFNQTESINVDVYDTTGDKWCSKQGPSLTINMVQGIKIVAYTADSSMAVSHSLHTSKKLQCTAVYPCCL